MDQLVSTISSPVALSVSAARLEAAAQLEGVVWSRLTSNGDTHTRMDRVPMQCSALALKSRAAARSSRAPRNMVKLWSAPFRGTRRGR